MAIIMSLLIKIAAQQNAILQFLNNVWQRALEIVKQPVLNPDIIWVMLPLIVAVILIQLYFGRYPDEKLGWTSALANSLILFFVGMNLFQWLFRNNMLFFALTKETVFLPKNIIALVIVVYSLSLMVLNFFHLLPRKVAFNMSSDIIINYLAVISITIVYSTIEISFLTLAAIFFLFMLFWAVVKSLQFLEPVAPLEEIAKEIKKDILEKEKELEEIKEIRDKELQKDIEEIRKEKKEIDGIAYEMAIPPKAKENKEKEIKKKPIKNGKKMDEEELFKKIDNLDKKKDK